MRKEKKDKKPSKPRSSKHNKGQNWNGFVPMERLVIPIQKYDAEVFRMLIQFVHTGTAYITQQNVAGKLNNNDNHNHYRNNGYFGIPPMVPLVILQMVPLVPLATIEPRTVSAANSTNGTIRSANGIIGKKISINERYTSQLPRWY